MHRAKSKQPATAAWRKCGSAARASNALTVGTRAARLDGLPPPHARNRSGPAIAARCGSEPWRSSTVASMDRGASISLSRANNGRREGSPRHAMAGAGCTCAHGNCLHRAVGFGDHLARRGCQTCSEGSWTGRRNIVFHGVTVTRWHCSWVRSIGLTSRTHSRTRGCRRLPEPRGWSGLAAALQQLWILSGGPTAIDTLRGAAVLAVEEPYAGPEQACLYLRCCRSARGLGQHVPRSPRRLSPYRKPEPVHYGLSSAGCAFTSAYGCRLDHVPFAS
jgi:hypothetical protein